MPRKYEFGFIGAGNMAEGIVSAAVKDKLFSPHEMIVSDPEPERRQLFWSRFGVAVAESNHQLVRDTQRIVWAIKPQQFDEVAGTLTGAIEPDHVHVSIMAGMSTRRIEAPFQAVNPRVVRVMPNLPIRVGAGMAGICAGQYATNRDVADVKTLFEAGGGAVVLKDEALMDAVTAVSGSGPAYFYYFVESIVAGGAACGLSETDALELARRTCLGAARMMLETKQPPSELRAKVTSKGGTTQAALEHMEKSGVGTAIRDAVRAAFNRGRELGS